MTFKPGHDICRLCGRAPLRHVERFVGICFSCNREKRSEIKLGEPPRFEFSNDESGNSTRFKDRKDK